MRQDRWGEKLDKPVLLTSSLPGPSNRDCYYKYVNRRSYTASTSHLQTALARTVRIKTLTGHILISHVYDGSD